MLSPSPPLERGLVWIVEDSPLEAEMTRRAIAGMHDSETFAEGAAMLERLASGGAPDVIVLDLVLPGISGIDVCRAIRRNHDEMMLPVLMLTMQSRKESILEALGVGVNDYLSKPFDARELMARVGGLVRTGRLHRAQAEWARQLARTEAERDSLLERETRARNAAEDANRLKDEFLAVLSHELRTPLNAIVGWTSLLKNGALPNERVPDTLDKVERNAKSLAQLIDDLLDISRIITGKMTLQHVEVDIENAARAALASVELAATRRGVALEVDLGRNLYALGEESRIQQIVWNLLSNAIRFTPKGGTVRLSCQRVADNVEIVVADSGQGIAREFLPHVFERFSQANTTKARSHGGLGLGLAIVRHFAELHGGSVEAESEGVGKGATFRVRIPIDDRSVSSMPPHADAVSRTALAGLEVLVVDDQPDALELMRALLEYNGVRVTTAPNADEALAHVRGRRFDVLISDIGMPNVDGLSFLRRVRELGKSGMQLPAVALTAYAGEQDRVQTSLAGFDAHVTKPLDASKLLLTLHQLTTRERPVRSDAPRKDSP